MGFNVIFNENGLGLEGFKTPDDEVCGAFATVFSCKAAVRISPA